MTSVTLSKSVQNIDPLVLSVAQMYALTQRQAEVLVGVIDGKTNYEIACEVGVKEKTVKFHLTKAYRSLGVQSRSQAIAEIRAKLRRERIRVMEGPKTITARDHAGKLHGLVIPETQKPVVKGEVYSHSGLKFTVLHAELFDMNFETRATSGGRVTIEYVGGVRGTIENAHDLGFEWVRVAEEGA